MAINKVVFGGETVVDLTEDTVDVTTLADGFTAHDASGKVIVGVMPTTTVLYTEQELTDAEQSQARTNVGVDKIDERLSGEIDDLDAELEVERQRIDQLVALEEGAVTGDFERELLDIRVGANGITYDNAGEAVREQYLEIPRMRVSATEPTTDNVEFWIDPTSDEEYSIPEIDDEAVSAVDTWSSQKINDEVGRISSLFVVNKNKLLLEYKRENTNGFTFEFKNGLFSLNGTVESTENVNIPLDAKYLNNEYYTLTVKRKSGTGVVDTMNICTTTEKGAFKTSFIGITGLTASNLVMSSGGEINKDERVLTLRFRVSTGAVFDNLVFEVQLEPGNNSTDFEEGQLSINANSPYADKEEVEELKKDISSMLSSDSYISPLRVCLVGDVHITDNTTSNSGANWLERVTLLANAVNKEHNKKPFDFLLCTGDLVYHPSADSSESYWINRLAYLFNMPVYVMTGNHEYAFSDERFREMVGNPRQFSIQNDSWYFVCLDTYAESTEYTGIDEDYIRAELEKSKDKKVIVCGHYFEDGDKDLLVSLIEEYQNIVCITYGHTHSWGQSQLSNGTWALNNGSFDNPKKSWATVGTDENPTTNLWGFRVLETNGSDLVTYQIQPAHTYSGINIDLPYSVNDMVTIGTFDVKEKADFVIGKHVNYKKYSDRFKYLEESNA